LDRVELLLQHFGNPHRCYPAIHVTGTNGKGSVCALLASALHAQGYRVGLYTSPHLIQFNERIRVSGFPISISEITQILPALLHEGERIGATFFEITTALAYTLFAHHNIDIAVVEVGMGGRYDATNVIHPLVAIITGVDYDHQQYLGATLEEIAWQKVGIVKRGCAVVIGEQRPYLRQLIHQWAREAGGGPIVIPPAAPEMISSTPDLQQFLRLPSGDRVLFPLAGEHQRRNLSLVLAARELIASDFPISDTALADGLSNVRNWGGLRARIEIVRPLPPFVIDVAHNPGGIAALLHTLDEHGYSGTLWHLVFGVMADKDYTSMLRLLQPRTACLFACTPATERALPAEQLASKAQEIGFRCVQPFSTVAEAIHAAWQQNEPTLVVGSFYLIGETLPILDALCAAN
ncbi:MAG: folylpolyglutamate synthase/dihydrofolate synthase family protein, partial [Bacteroidota bacterium]|nr:folylpolyglutamate synthase/dihydrofolate synthase family protein [Bacteroidota bacterium]